MTKYSSWEMMHLNTVAYKNLDYVFDNELNIEPMVTDQRDTGRCWMFAGLNCMRIPVIEKYKLPLNFNFSTNYLFFWDKYERCKYFLEKFPEIDKSRNPRVRDHLLRKPVFDGGQWHMFVNLVNKYGVIPKESFNETYASNCSHKLNAILNHRLKYAILNNDENEKVLEEIKCILVSYLGNPPTYIDFKYTLDNGYEKKCTLTPKMYYNFYIKDLYDVDNYANIINDPRNPYQEHYTVDFLNNMIDSPGPLYYNLPMDELTTYAQQSILQNKGVWIGCDISKYSSRTHALLGYKYFPDAQNCLTKKERLMMLDSALSHAMVLHGYSKDKWKFENSWGYHGSYKGFYVADNQWFEEYVYQAIVPKTLVKTPPKWSRPRKYKPWDPFGSISNKPYLLKL